MSFQIEVLKVGVENKGKYRVAVVDHKTADGKVDSKKIMSFVNKDVFATLSVAQQGDQFEINSAKDDNGYWQWTSVQSVGKGGSGPFPGTKVASAVRSTYETPEERAARQVYIVRQSSITAALTYIGDFKGDGARSRLSIADVIGVAKEFEAYVFSKDVVPAEVQ